MPNYCNFRWKNQFIIFSFMICKVVKKVFEGAIFQLLDFVCEHLPMLLEMCNSNVTGLSVLASVFERRLHSISESQSNNSKYLSLR